MYQSVIIHNFRGFEDFSLHDLGRVNLLVGENNSGKSTVLEVLHLLASGGRASVLWDLAWRRGELMPDIDTGRSEIDPSHLFHGHKLTTESVFGVRGLRDSTVDSLEASVAPQESNQELLFNESERASITDREGIKPFFDTYDGLALRISSSLAKTRSWPFSSRGGLTDEILRRLRIQTEEGRPVKFVSTAGQSVEEIVAQVEQYILTPEEAFAIDALRVIEPDLDRIATRGGRRRYADSGGKGGIVLKFKNDDFPVPIGSMGDGMWRLLGMALALASARNGILLIDEIDTGLHYTTMDRMWKLLDEAARRLSVQVFATTHSRDCLESLAVIAGQTDEKTCEATIQRIERGRTRSVAYTTDEIIAAAKRGIEVR